MASKKCQWPSGAKIKLEPSVLYRNIFHENYSIYLSYESLSKSYAVYIEIFKIMNIDILYY